MGYISYRVRGMAHTYVVLDRNKRVDITINMDKVCAFYKAENEDYTMVMLDGGTICLGCTIDEFNEVYNEYLNNSFFK